MSNNPFIEPENYHQGYQDSIDKNKDNPDALKLEKLCYAIFTGSDEGKELINLFEERFISPALVPVGSKDYELLLTYFEGFKQAFRMIKDCIKFHENRIKSEK